MSVYLSIHEVKGVAAPDVRSYDHGELEAYVSATIRVSAEEGPRELTFFADEREELGLLGAATMTAEQVVELVLASLTATGLDRRTSVGARRDAANNIAQALQGVWVKP
jgi:hypothetical protein